MPSDILEGRDAPPVGQLECSVLSSLGPSSATHKIQGSPRTQLCILLSFQESGASPTLAPLTACLTRTFPPMGPQPVGPLPWWPRNMSLPLTQPCQQVTLGSSGRGQSTCHPTGTGDFQASSPHLQTTNICGLSLLHTPPSLPHPHGTTASTSRLAASTPPLPSGGLLEAQV